ncbi:prefoldin subunit alpha [Candidatus Woesearchaeota archaeon]|nr:prefoldin subunit alpha [Candidatus Woesearchaeota archaeon]
MENKKDQQEIQQKHMQLQMLDQQMQQVQKQLQMLDQQIKDLQTTSQALTDIREVKPGTEVLFPISNGIFLKGELKENDRLTINVGANTSVEKTIDEGKELLDNQLQELIRYKLELDQNISKLSSKAMELEKEISSANQ